MLAQVRDWLGFGGHGDARSPGGHSGPGHRHGSEGGHGHTHGVIDPGIAATERGIWAIKWSFVILAVTAAIQLGVVLISGSVALLADTIHNVGDATTAIPLWFAFVLARRKPSRTFTYGLGRAEDLAGILIVLIILFSAVVAAYEAVSRLVNPQPVTQLGWLAVAGIVGFLGNEIVAVFRIRVGRQMNSAALIADGYHARTDGLTSLAVVLGALGVWLGYPLTDPIIGLLITVAIFGIVWQSSRAVLTRMLDGVDPSVVEEIRHAAEHVLGIEQVLDSKARWLGHALHADVTIAVDDGRSLAEAQAIAGALEAELRAHLPALAVANVRFGPRGAAPSVRSASAAQPGAGAEHRSPEPFEVSSPLAEGMLQIVDTPDGERVRLTLTRQNLDLAVVLVIARGQTAETLVLRRQGSDAFQSAEAPGEPHTFEAVLRLTSNGQSENLPLRMTEPAGHRH